MYPSFAVRFEPGNNVVYTITGAGVAVPAGVLRVPVPLQQAAHHCQPLLGGRGFQNQVNPSHNIIGVTHFLWLESSLTIYW